MPSEEFHPFKEYYDGVIVAFLSSNNITSAEPQPSAWANFFLSQVAFENNPSKWLSPHLPLEIRGMEIKRPELRNYSFCMRFLVPSSRLELKTRGSKPLVLPITPRWNIQSEP